MPTYQDVMAKHGRKKREYPEFKECRAFARNIRETIKAGKAPNLLHWMHIPNEGKENAKLVSIGLLSGAPDYIFIYKKIHLISMADGGFLKGTAASVAYIEFKVPGEKLKPEQEVFRQHCVDNGVPYLLAYETRRAVKWLIEIGVIEE